MNYLSDSPLKIIGSLLTAVLMTIVIVGGGLLVFRFVGPIPLSISQTLTQKESTFNVTGESEVSAIPDEAEISAGIEITESTVAAAQKRANQVTNDILDALQKMGIKKEDIKTQNYSVSPQYDYDQPGSPRIAGYRVDSMLRITVTDFEKLNDIIDTSTRLGANQVGGINFKLSKDKEKELLKQARKEAIDNAQEQAKELAGLSGIKLGKVVNVIENKGYYPSPIYMAAEKANLPVSGGGDASQIEPGQSSFTYSVMVSYETF